MSSGSRFCAGAAGHAVRSQHLGGRAQHYQRPADVTEFGGFVNAEYGNFDELSLQGAVNVPIIQDTLAMRVTGAYRKRDGFLDVVDRNGNTIGDTNDVDQWLVRGQIGWDT